MELIDLEKELFKKDTWLFTKLTEQKGLIQKSAQAEETYRVALATKMLTLKAEGCQATLIPDLARGDKNVAKLKLERDIAEGIADACKQSIYAIQTSMSGLQSLIASRRAEMTLL